MGYALVDLLVDRRASLPEAPAGRLARTWKSTERELDEPMPLERSDFAAIMRQAAGLLADLAPHDHPRFFTLVPSPSNLVSVLAETLAAGFNINTATWRLASSAVQIELTTVRWLVDMVGMPATAGGTFVSGGSTANFTALAAALQRANVAPAEGFAYISEFTHPIVDRALRLLGVRPEHVRHIATDAAGAMQIDDLRVAVAADRAAGLTPFCVVATAGTTDTGAVDPLRALAVFTRSQALWLHVDGSYGAPAVLTARGALLLDGIGEADSVALDPHKWLFQPYEIGCVLVRDRAHLHDTFRLSSPYLRALEHETAGPDPKDYGLQLSRGFGALKLWMSMKVFGIAAFREAIDRGLDLAEFAELTLSRSPGFRIITPARLGIVTFRREFPRHSNAAGDELNRKLAADLNDEGFATVGATTVFGRAALRMCTINPRTTDADITNTVARLADLGDLADRADFAQRA